MSYNLQEGAVGQEQRRLDEERRRDAPHEARAAASRARVGARAMRAREFECAKHGFRPFGHDTFLLSPDVQRFVPGFTWSYVPPRDRPRHPSTGCVCQASSVPGMLHIENCSARQPGEPWRKGGLWS